MSMPNYGTDRDNTVDRDSCDNGGFDSTGDVSGNEETTGANNDATSSCKKGFFAAFFGTSGAPQILVLGFLLSLGSGSFVSIIPGVVGDRFARLDHGYDGPPCADFHNGDDKPVACSEGGDEAQNAAANAAFIKNLILLLLSSIVGSVSDCRGRKGFMALGFFLVALTPLALLMLQLFPSMSPLWFYASLAGHGLTSSFTIGVTILSDVMPPALRAPGFGLFLSFYMVGFALSQFFVKCMSHASVTVAATAILASGCLFSLLVLPETLPEAARRKAIEKHARENTTWVEKLFRPILELSILNRNNIFRLLAVVSFCSGMIYSSDTTLIVYYMKNNLDIGYRLISTMFFWKSLVGVLVQMFVLKALIDWLGEQRTLILGLVIGAVHNVLYGLAASEAVVFVGLLLSELSSIHFPVLVSIRSTNVGDDEQGHVQGAFFALAAIADAIGPVFLQSIYNRTKDTGFPGPGAMFVIASGVYFFGALVSCAMPPEKTNTTGRGGGKQIKKQQHDNNNESINVHSLEGNPLLVGHRPSIEND